MADGSGGPGAGSALPPMLVAAYAGGGRLRLERRPRPFPGPGELLLRLRVCGLCGTDLFKLSASAAAEGTVLGHEIVGEVSIAGSGARGPAGEIFQEGDRVVVPHHVACGECSFCRRGSETMCPVFQENLLEPGGFSEHVLVRARAACGAAWIVPPDVSDDAAVFLEPAACVIRGVWRSDLREEGVAAIIGAGSMGLLHLLVLRAASPGVKVIAVDPIAERRGLALRLGADLAVDPGEIGSAAAELSGGPGADAVFDTVGGSRILAAALRATRPGGTVVLFAHAAPEERAGFDLNFLFKAERRVVGTYSGARREQSAIRELIASGRLDASPLVTARLPLSRIDEAVERSRAHRDLKILLYPEG
ncbi:MAG: alcohol dehydrogenase catalytic domain-containing protein [Planctomycetes bacterium]|nr:alcohol dehydrogenase catalytic domain-containing protein [Planctomycetota bacterium]